MRSIFVSSFLLSVILFTSCQKSLEEPQLKKGAGTGLNSAKNRFGYGASELYLDVSNPVVLPQGLREQGGSFRAIPAGLSIDAATGAINVGASMTGMPFKVFHIGSNGKVLDSTRVMVSGIDYEDGIYTRTDARGGSFEINPSYNGNSTVAVPFVSLSENVEIVACDLNGDGEQDKVPPGLARLGLRSKNGAISLNDFANSNFWRGSRAVDGAMVEFKITYRLQDASRGAANSLNVRMYYYSREENVPASIKQTIDIHKAIKARVNKMRIGNTGEEGDDGTIDPLAGLDAFGRPARPPHLVIIG